MLYDLEEDGKTLDRAGYSQALKDAGVTHEEAKAYWSNVANSDPYAQASKEIAKTVSAQWQHWKKSFGLTRCQAASRGIEEFEGGRP